MKTIIKNKNDFSLKVDSNIKDYIKRYSNEPTAAQLNMTMHNDVRKSMIKADFQSRLMTVK